jgi:hypothetical protein
MGSGLLLSGGTSCAAAAPLRQNERTKASAIFRIRKNSLKIKG